MGPGNDKARPLRRGEATGQGRWIRDAAGRPVAHPAQLSATAAGLYEPARDACQQCQDFTGGDEMHCADCTALRLIRRIDACRLRTPVY